MPKSPDTITISALIQHADKEGILLDINGNPPSVAHERGNGTYEEIFRELGRRVTGLYIGVERRVHSEDIEPGCITYLSKPVAFEPQPNDIFQWR